jgi:DNA-binding transcriptional LysR family regulator
MELRHLRYFTTAVWEGGVTKAAKRLNIAQPPLSRQIRQLEEEVGVLLLEPGSRPLRHDGFFMNTRFQFWTALRRF